ncbi:MAG TPA: adenylate/guanylate cyclase domain-containing protein, partial [Bacteroidia bacterium]
FHGTKPLAYLVLGDAHNNDVSVSNIIKHLNFLQLLTNVVVSAIENNRLSREVLKQEQEQRKLIENQNEMLEKLVDARTKELKTEKEESERLLHNILPRTVADELKEKGFTTPLRFNDATILFTDFKEFTQASSQISPQVLIGELNDIFMAFDFIMEKHGLEKIKTIGDSYMAAAGLPKKSRTHAIHIVRAGFEMLSFLENRKQHADIKWEMRVGVNSGALVAGVVGAKKFTYDIWGDTVNIASRMESSSQVGRINISHTTAELIKDYFEYEYRGKHEVKGKGEVDMYFVLHEKESERYKKLKKFVIHKLKTELPKNLFYHNLNHSLDVCDAAFTIALHENIGWEDIELIKSAALLHDSGFIKRYKENEEIGCEIAREVLPQFNYSPKEIETICGMIMATKVPETPKNILEEILCDADLDYLGRSDFKAHAKNLVDELNANENQIDEAHWRNIQIKFLSNHRYFTKTSRELREDEKQKHLEKLKSTQINP